MNYLSISKNFLYQVKKSIRLGNFDYLNLLYLPQYFRDNRKKSFFHIKEMKPWITYSSYFFLKKILNKNMLVFEYGSGGSTFFYASRVNKVVSVEHEEKWKAFVQDELRKKGVLNVDLFFEPPIKIDNSKPENVYYSIHGHGWEDYDFVSYVKKIDSYPDEYFDVLVIDGRARPFCLRHGLDKVKSGGYIVYDNLERESYKDDFLNSILSWKVHEGFGPLIGDKSFTNTFIFKKP
jgi:hypothetical protein